MVPDVHLKPWIFEKASRLISKEKYDAVVMLGDLVDDWYQERNVLYLSPKHYNPLQMKMKNEIYTVPKD